MGTDIHLYVEKRQGDRWVSADKWQPSRYGEGLAVDYDDMYYTHHNYDLFAILADVRNGISFFGFTTGDGFVPIAQPRGVPDDASPEYKAVVEHWGRDGHSHSYLTVAEIMAYDWTQTTTKEAVVDLPQWAAWKRHGQPNEYSAASFGEDVLMLPEEEISRAFEKLDLDAPDESLKLYRFIHYTTAKASVEALTNLIAPGKIIRTTVRWEVAYYEVGRYFLSETMAKLWRLGPPDQVRVLFFFDN